MNQISTTLALLISITSISCSAEKKAENSTVTQSNAGEKSSNITESKEGDTNTDPLSTQSAPNAKLVKELGHMEEHFGARAAILRQASEKIGINAYGWSLQLYSSSVTKLAGDILALYRLEQLFSTAGSSQLQRDILATHYFFVAQGALSLKPNLRLFSERDSSGEELWNALRSELDSAESKFRARSKELSPKLYDEMERGAAGMTQALKNADQ